MPGMRVDFSDIETFETIKEGVYTGHIESIRFREAREEGKSDQLSVCVVADEGEAKGEKAWQNLYFSPKALWRMAKFFGLFGITEADLEWAEDEPFDLLDPDLTGEPVIFVVKRDGSYQGQPSFKTEVIEWLGASARPAAAETPEKDPAKRTFAPSKGKDALPARRTMR